MIFVFTFSCFCKVDWCTIDSHLSGCFCSLPHTLRRWQRSTNDTLLTCSDPYGESTKFNVCIRFKHDRYVVWIVTNNRQEIITVIRRISTNWVQQFSIFRIPWKYEYKMETWQSIFNKFLSVFVNQNIQSIFKQKTNKQGCKYHLVSTF